MKTIQLLSGFDYIDSRHYPKRILITFRSNQESFLSRGIWLYSDEISFIINKIRKKFNTKNISLEDWNIPIFQEKIFYLDFIKLYE